MIIAKGGFGLPDLGSVVATAGVYSINNRKL
jgi:hypothetical protein